jgi:hypothetical protein
LQSEVYTKLFADGLISESSFENVQRKNVTPAFSVNWEIRVLLYAGVILLCTGLNLLIYKNIDAIGHQVILAFIALLSIGCFTYCLNKKLPFSWANVKAPNKTFYYILLLGSISMSIFTGYLQYQYDIFGTNYGIAIFIPMLALFFIAYYFDHQGILNMAITGLALWMGVSVTPKTLLASGTFNNKEIVFTYLLLGYMLLAIGYLTRRFDIKKHFNSVYNHYGVHTVFITLLAGYFEYYSSSFCLLWLLAVFAVATYIYLDGFKDKTFYPILLSILYAYLAACCLFGKLIFGIGGYGIGSMSVLLIFFIASALGLTYLIVYVNKKLKTANDHI